MSLNKKVPECCLLNEGARGGIQTQIGKRFTATLQNSSPIREHALSIRAFIYIGDTDTGRKIVANPLGNKINIANVDGRH